MAEERPFFVLVSVAVVWSIQRGILYSRLSKRSPDAPRIFGARFRVGEFLGRPIDVGEG